MDWFSWLSKTSLEPSLIYEYSLAFAQNQLEEEDIPYLNHELLQSMGIIVAKHRIEILKLARKPKRASPFPLPKPLLRLIIAIRKTKRRVCKCIRMWGRRKDSGRALVRSNVGSSRSLGRSIGSSSRWKAAMLKRSKRFAMAIGNSNRMVLTNGSFRSIIGLSGRIDSFSSSLAYDVRADHDEKVQGECDEYWLPALEDNGLDSVLQNLKPT